MTSYLDNNAGQCGDAVAAGLVGADLSLLARIHGGLITEG